mmetsp:Transcript_81900/g.171340  ORF Transcript_81900/g.171340 Transcript_81900/m.171340 type:complete len:821 (+) Transcript_81900:239-2701(+)
MFWGTRHFCIFPLSLSLPLSLLLLPLMLMQLLLLCQQGVEVNAYTGYDTPAECDEQTTICWSTTLRTPLMQGFYSPVQPPPRSHNLSCLRHSAPDFRSRLAVLFRDPSRISFEEIQAFTAEHKKLIMELAAMHQHMKGSFDPTEAGHGTFLVLERSDCFLAYFVGLLLFGFVQGTSVDDAYDLIQETGALEYFWYMAMNWADISSTSWPLLQIFEFFSLHFSGGLTSGLEPFVDGVEGVETVSSGGGSQDNSSASSFAFSAPSALSYLQATPFFMPAALELRWDVLEAIRRPGKFSRTKWATWISRLSDLPTISFVKGIIHVLLALTLVVTGDESHEDRAARGWQIQEALRKAQYWFRALKRRPFGFELLLKTAWPALELWGLFWRDPVGVELLSVHNDRCSASFDPLWTSRRIVSELWAARVFPDGRWPMSLLHPATASSSSSSSIASTLLLQPSPKSTTTEAWATSLAVPHGANLQSRSMVWIDAVRVMHASVRRHEHPGNRRPFLLLVDYHFPKEYADILQQEDIEIVVADSIGIRESIALCGSTQRRAEGLRFRIFGLTQYEKIVYLDADVILTSSLDHLFSVPKGIFMSATVNGTRWAYSQKMGLQDQWHYPKVPGILQGPPLINTGVMLITPSKEFETSIEEVNNIKEWEESTPGWWSCDVQKATTELSKRVCQTYGIFAGYCTQGLIDVVMLAKYRRLGEAIWHAETGDFLGCRAAWGSDARLVMPKPGKDQCIFDESYNWQVTRPHLEWHMPFARSLVVDSTNAGIRVVHWPGRPKPWTVTRSQHTAFERQWWALHDFVCIDESSNCALSCP